MQKCRVLKLLHISIVGCYALVNVVTCSATDDEELVNKNYTLSFRLNSGSSASLTPSFENLYEAVEDKIVDHHAISGVRIDLHGKSLSEAREIVIERLKKVRTLGAQSVHFICGRGNHKNSKGKRGVLLKSFPEWLQHESVASFIETHHQTMGAYEVILKPLSSSEEIKPVTYKALKVEVIHKLAELEVPQAQFILGEMYIKGDRVEKNNKLAVEWLRKSAEQGLDEAQLLLGYMYAMGMGTKYNPQGALQWYRKAGEQGNSVALRNIATMYYVGEGVPRDFKKAAQYYHEAADLKEAVSMNMLGIMHRRGEGVKQDDTEAVKWDRRGAEAGQPHAKVNLGCMLMIGRGVERNEVEGAKWLREGAEYGLAEGQMRLGMAYEQGQGVQQDYKEAYKWYLKAAVQENGPHSANALFFLGHLYEEGRGVEKNIELANQWFLRAAKNKHAGAQAELGHHYRFGCGFVRNYTEAIKWYYKAARQEHASAQYNLGEMYEMGQGVRHNKKKASYWIKKAAENGDTMALLRFGIISSELQEAMETLPLLEDEIASSEQPQISSEKLSSNLEEESILVEDEVFDNNRQEQSEGKAIASFSVEETYPQEATIQKIASDQSSLTYSSWLYNLSKTTLTWIRDYIFG